MEGYAATWTDRVDVWNRITDGKHPVRLQTAPLKFGRYVLMFVLHGRSEYRRQAWGVPPVSAVPSESFNRQLSLGF